MAASPPHQPPPYFRPRPPLPSPPPSSPASLAPPPPDDRYWLNFVGVTHEVHDLAWQVGVWGAKKRSDVDMRDEDHYADVFARLIEGELRHREMRLDIALWRKHFRDHIVQSVSQLNAIEERYYQLMGAIRAYEAYLTQLALDGRRADEEEERQRAARAAPSSAKRAAPDSDDSDDSDDWDDSSSSSESSDEGEKVTSSVTGGASSAATNNLLPSIQTAPKQSCLCLVQCTPRDCPCAALNRGCSRCACGCDTTGRDQTTTVSKKHKKK